MEKVSPAAGVNQGAQQQWQGPPLGYVKCNMDAAFFQREHQMGIGICIRNDVVPFMMAKSHWRDTMLSVKEGEAFALLVAIQWIKDIGLQYVIFESDSKSVVDNIHSSLLYVDEYGSLITHCKSLLLSLPYCKVQFASRSVNTDAHQLARNSIHYPRSVVFLCSSVCNLAAFAN